MPVTDLVTRPGIEGPAEPGELLVGELTAWADNPSAVLALNQDTRRWRCPRTPGIVAYRDHGHSRVQVLGPIAPNRQAQHAVQAAFLSRTRAERRHSVAIQLQAHDVPMKVLKTEVPIDFI